MAIKKKGLNLAQVAHTAGENFVAPTPLESNDNVRERVHKEYDIEEEVRKRLEQEMSERRKKCTFKKTGGFPIYLEPDDKDALNFILCLNGIDKQNVVRAAVHTFLQQHYTTREGLDQAGLDLVNNYIDSIYV